MGHVLVRTHFITLFFGAAAVPELPVQPAIQRHPDWDRQGAPLLQHPRDLHGQPRVLAGARQPHGERGQEVGRPARPEHAAAGIHEGKKKTAVQDFFLTCDDADGLYK